MDSSSRRLRSDGLGLPGDTPAMRPWDAISEWRMRRSSRPLRDQLRRNEQRLEDGPVAWRDWWSRHGERELRCILMSAWDPLGTGDVPEAWDEYDSYIP